MLCCPQVLVDEGLARAAYPLDEGIINFGSALEDADFEYAMQVLEPLPRTPETVVQWERLAAQALETNQVRCSTSFWARVRQGAGTGDQSGAIRV